MPWALGALRDGEVARWVRLKRPRKVISPPRSAAKGSLPYILDIWWLLLPCKNPKMMSLLHTYALFDHFILRGDGNHYTDLAAWSHMTEKCHLCGQPWLPSVATCCYMLFLVLALQKNKTKLGCKLIRNKQQQQQQQQQLWVPVVVSWCLEPGHIQ